MTEAAGEPPTGKSNAVAVARLLLRPPVLILVAANLVPLIGVIAWGWDAFVLLMLYWLETAVIAFWTIVRIATLPRDALGKIRYEGSDQTPSPLGLRHSSRCMPASSWACIFSFSGNCSPAPGRGNSQPARFRRPGDRGDQAVGAADRAVRRARPADDVRDRGASAAAAVPAGAAPARQARGGAQPRRDAAVRALCADLAAGLR